MHPAAYRPKQKVAVTLRRDERPTGWRTIRSILIEEIVRPRPATISRGFTGKWLGRATSRRSETATLQSAGCKLLRRRRLFGPDFSRQYRACGTVRAQASRCRKPKSFPEIPSDYFQPAVAPRAESSPSIFSRCSCENTAIVLGDYEHQLPSELTKQQTEDLLANLSTLKSDQRSATSVHVNA